MSGPGLFLSGDLDALVERYVATLDATREPLVRGVVVVPNAAVGQWFEQAVARLTGRDGGHDGVVANVDTIFPAALIGRAVYGDARALERWSAWALAVELMTDEDEAPLTMTDALARGSVLERMIIHRAEELDALLLAAGLQRERHLLARRAAHGELSPAARFARDGAPHRDQLGAHVAVVACLASSVGGLLADVTRTLADSVRVDLFFPVTARELVEGEDAGVRDASLLTRWGASTRALVDLWRARAAPSTETWIDVRPAPSRDAAVAALADGSTRVTEPGIFLEVHRAVGVARQVEVARDAILRTLLDTGLAPHQVRVVSPDPSRVAPLLSLFFQTDDSSDLISPRMQFEMADPLVARASARLDGLLAMLSVVGGDLTVYDVALLVGQPSLRAGLGLSGRDATRIIDLAREGRISLGLDAMSRAPLGLFDPDDDTGTWTRLVDRVVLASVFEGDDGTSGEVATLGVADDLVVIARFHELVEWLRASARDVAVPHDLVEWIGIFTRWSGLLARDERQRDSGLDQLLARLEGLAVVSTRSISYSDARDLVESLAGASAGATLVGRGGAAVLNLNGSAAIPFEVTCVIGLDDEALPDSSRVVAGMGADRITDPDPRREFRAALLGLVASTRQRLVVITNDRSVVDGSALPTTLPLAELVDALEPAGLVREVRHPRHGHSLTGGDPGDAPVAAGLSYDPVHATVADALSARDLTRPEGDVALVRLEAAEREAQSVVDVRRLAEYFRHPQRIFLRDALGAAALHAGRAEEIPDVPYLDLGGALAMWSLRERLLREAVESGVAPAVPTGPDSLLAGVVTGLRRSVLAEVNTDELARYASQVRSSLALIDATRDPRGRRPSVVRGQRHEVTRPPVELFQSTAGPLLIRFTSATGYASRVMALVTDLAVVTVETGEAVTGVLLRGRSADDATRRPEAWPFLTATWPGEPVAAAQRLLSGLLRLYAQRFDGLPLHFYGTSLAYGSRQLGLGLSDVVESPDKEWFSAGFGEYADRGESLEAENQLLIPLDYAELMEVFDGAVGAASLDLAQVLSAVAITAHPGTTPWTTVVSSLRGDA